MKKLGGMQQAIYDYIRGYIAQNSYPPTLREICAAVGLKSTSGAYRHVQSLQKLGYLNLNPATKRSIALAAEPCAARAGEEAVCYAPLVGTVAAGAPIFAFDNILGEYPLPAGLVRGARQEDLFLLEVRGESMIGAGIRSGDKIVVDRGAQAENGDIAVARVEGETATVKRIFFEKPKIRLQPENPDMEPIYADYADVVIVGRVVGLIRQY